MYSKASPTCREVQGHHVLKTFHPFVGHNQPQTNWRDLHNHVLCTEDRLVLLLQQITRVLILHLLIELEVEMEGRKPLSTHYKDCGCLVPWTLCLENPALKFKVKQADAAVKACCRNHKYFESYGKSDVAQSKCLPSMKHVEPIKSFDSSNKLLLDRKTALNSSIWFKISISSHVFHGGLSH